MAFLTSERDPLLSDIFYDESESDISLSYNGILAYNTPDDSISTSDKSSLELNLNEDEPLDVTSSAVSDEESKRKIAALQKFSQYSSLKKLASDYVSPPRLSPTSLSSNVRLPNHQFGRLSNTTNRSPMDKLAQTFDELSQPIPQRGALILSQDEIDGFRSAGIAVPSKLPLSDSEINRLHQIRRKIKNKIAAQLSRVKKRAYISSIEQQIQASEARNFQLQSRIEEVESYNAQLLSELKALRERVTPGEAFHSVSKKRRLSIQRPEERNKSSLLMVLALFFGLFVGSFHPETFLDSGQWPAISSKIRFPIIFPSESSAEAFSQFSQTFVNWSWFSYPNSCGDNDLTHFGPQLPSRVLLSLNEPYTEIESICPGGFECHGKTQDQNSTETYTISIGTPSTGLAQNNSLFL